MKRLLAALLATGLAACASAPKQPPPAGAVVGHAKPAPAPPTGGRTSPYAPAQEDLSKRGHYQAGGLYAAHIPDSTPDHIPDVDAIPEPEVTAEPRSRVGNRSTYAVLGKQYHVLDDPSGYVEEGLASYYGNKFHGRRTSNLEVYDMYAFTAAHKTLPLPSFARVTNRDNGRSIVVRVNDRGPFHDGRVIDLSYAAAVKLGITQRGTGRVEVRALTPGEGASPAFALALAAATPTPPMSVSGSTSMSTSMPTSMPAPASRLDQLVAAMPIAAAGTLPPGVRIATGKPIPRAGNAGGERPIPGATRASAPGVVGSAVVAAGTPPAAPALPSVTAAPATAHPHVAAGNDYRFDMRQDGKAMSADEFDAWMQSRRVRVATGKPVLSVGNAGDEGPAPSVANAGGERPAPGARRAPPASSRIADAGTAAAPAVIAPPPAPRQAANTMAAALAAVSPIAGVTLQIASFSARGNADRALAMLRGAGIDGARLNDANANGQKVWRLRVGPLDAAHAPELAARIAGLGFGQPQRVRD